MTTSRSGAWRALVAEHGRSHGRPPDRYYGPAAGVRSAQGLTNPAYGGDAAKLRFVECGNSVAALNDYLFAAGLSIKGCGSNNGQTIAGALSTGTMAAPTSFGAMQEMVVGLHLITGPDKHVYLERKSYPVMQSAFAESIGADFIQDDTLFNAALVSSALSESFTAS